MSELRSNTITNSNFVWCADLQENLREPLYVDAVHYTASFSQTIAREISRAVVERQLAASSSIKNP
jgi:hypothetical protein